LLRASVDAPFCSMDTGLSSVERRLRRMRVGAVWSDRCFGEQGSRWAAIEVEEGKGKKDLLQAARETRPSKCMKEALNLTKGSDDRQYAAKKNRRARAVKVSKTTSQSGIGRRSWPCSRTVRAADVPLCIIAN
jgi:hypothetical protein